MMGGISCSPLLKFGNNRQKEPPRAMNFNLLVFNTSLKVKAIAYFSQTSSLTKNFILHALETRIIFVLHSFSSQLYKCFQRYVFLVKLE